MLRRADTHEQGTVLLLFPAAALIMIVLGAMVIDVSLSQVRARELESVASSAANDALGALDVHHLRSTGEISPCTVQYDGSSRTGEVCAAA